jgi:hypothetical protein
MYCKTIYCTLKRIYEYLHLILFRSCLKEVEPKINLISLLVQVCIQTIHTDKKENKIFLIFKEIHMGSGAKSYMRKGFLIYEEMHKYFHYI